MTTTAAAIEPEEAPVTHGYRAVWRWHFFAGLWIAPFLVILTLTGAIYLFDREFDGWWNRDIQTIAAGGAPLPLAQQEAVVLRRYAGVKITRVRLPRGANEAAVWNIQTSEGISRDVYLDPYRGRITGTTDPAMQPMAIVRQLHASLMGGRIGGYIVELVACWTLIMMATGIWLWWPRQWKLKGVLVPRLSTRGRRYWRDLHSIPAMFNAAFVILLVLTGMPWSAFWGPQFAKLGEVVPFVAASPNFKAPPQADGNAQADMHAAHNKAAMQDPDSGKIPWTIRHSPMPHGSGAGGVGIAEIEALLLMLDTARFGGGVRIFYPGDDKGVFMLNYVPDKAEGQRTIYVDPGTGRIIGNIGWSDYSPVAKAVEWGVETHMGRQYGLANQIANLLVCLALIGGVVAGLTLWWKRRPAGRLAAPQLVRGDRMPGGVKAMIVMIAILFPLVAVSMIPIWLWGVWRKSGV
jgi:uncharacterized iron-regulated membrane protein